MRGDFWDPNSVHVHDSTSESYDDLNGFHHPRMLRPRSHDRENSLRSHDRENFSRK